MLNYFLLKRTLKKGKNTFFNSIRFWYSTTKNDFVREFFQTNEQLCDKYDHGIIGKDEIRYKRFHLIFSRLGMGEVETADEIQELFISECPKRGKLIEYARKIVEVLFARYALHIITNGFKDIQFTKLESSGLSGFFQEVITSERAMCRKPDAGIFQFAFDAAGASKEHTVMIGDNLTTDIVGARDIGLDHIYFNPSQRDHSEDIMMEISHLKELEDLLINV